MQYDFWAANCARRRVLGCKYHIAMNLLFVHLLCLEALKGKTAKHIKNPAPRVS